MDVGHSVEETPCCPSSSVPSDFSSALVALGRRFRSVFVVLLVVNLLAVLVLLLIDLLLLLASQRASVGGALVVDLLINTSLVAVGSGGLTGGHLAAAQAVGGALLLVGFPVVHFVRVDGVCVVLLVVDLAAGGVLFAVDLLALLAGQLSAVGGAIVVDLLVDPRLGAVGAGRFAGGHLA